MQPDETSIVFQSPHTKMSVTVDESVGEHEVVANANDEHVILRITTEADADGTKAHARADLSPDTAAALADELRDVAEIARKQN